MVGVFHAADNMNRVKIKTAGQILHGKVCMIIVLHILHDFSSKIVRSITEFGVCVQKIEDIKKVLLLLKRVQSGPKFFSVVAVFIDGKHEQRFNKASEKFSFFFGKLNVLWKSNIKHGITE